MKRRRLIIASLIVASMLGLSVMKADKQALNSLDLVVLSFTTA